MTEHEHIHDAAPAGADTEREQGALPVRAKDPGDALPQEYPSGSSELLPDGAGASAPATTDDEGDDTPGRTAPSEAAPDLRDIPLSDLHEIANIRPQYYGLDDLRESMRVQGQLEAAMVRPAPPGAGHDKPWELVFGYRRKRAAEMLEWTHLRCEVRDLANHNVLDVMITENLQREDLSAIAEAKAMKAMVELGGMSQAAVARRLGKDPSHVSHRLQLLGLSAPIMEKIDKGEISASHGEVIASLPEAQQERFANKAAAGNISVSKLTSWVRKAKQELEEEPPEDPEDLMPVSADDVVQIPHVALRHDLSDDDLVRLNAYVLLRSANDQEMLEYLEDTHELPYEGLWPWVSGLSVEDARELSRRLVRRYVEAGHRFGSIDPQLVDELGDREVMEGRSAFTATPSLSDGDIEPADGMLDAGGWLPPAGFDEGPMTHALPPAEGDADPWAPAALPAAHVAQDPSASDDNPWGAAALGAVEGVDEDITLGQSLLSAPPATEAADAPGEDQSEVDEDSGDWIGALRANHPGLFGADDADDDGDVAEGDAGGDDRDAGDDVRLVAQDAVIAEIDDDPSDDHEAADDDAPREAADAEQTEDPIDDPADEPAEEPAEEADVAERAEEPAGANNWADEPAPAAPEPVRADEAPADQEPVEVSLARRLADAIRERQPDLAAEKTEQIAQRTAEAGGDVAQIAQVWLRTGAFAPQPNVGGISPALLGERMGKPSLVFSALCALGEDPERARAALAAVIAPAPEPFDMERAVAALMERQGLDADKARAIVLRVEGADRQIQDAVMAWVRDGRFPTEPLIAGQTPETLAEHLGAKASLVMSALVALRENPTLVLERLGLPAP